jgi:aspartate aminotransferase-like enzyme
MTNEKKPLGFFMNLLNRERCWAKRHLKMWKLATYTPPVALVRRFRHSLCSAPSQAFHLVLKTRVNIFTVQAYLF